MKVHFIQNGFLPFIEAKKLPMEYLWNLIVEVIFKNLERSLFNFK